MTGYDGVMTPDEDQLEQIRHALASGQFVVCDRPWLPPPYVYVNPHDRAVFVHQCAEGEVDLILADEWWSEGPEEGVVVEPVLGCDLCGIRGRYRDGWVPA